MEDKINYNYKLNFINYKSICENSCYNRDNYEKIYKL